MRSKFIAIVEVLAILFCVQCYAEETENEEFALSVEGFEVFEEVIATDEELAENETGEATATAEENTETEIEQDDATNNEDEPAEESSQTEGVTEVEEEAELYGTEIIAEEIYDQSDELYLKAEVYDINVLIDEETKSVEIQIEGENLLEKSAAIKIAPLGSYNDLYYIRTVSCDDERECVIYATLPAEATGLCRVDVDMAELGHWSKVAAIGESENLVCQANRKTATISGQCETTGIHSVQIKVLDENGNIIFLRQKNSDASGAFDLNVTLPAESLQYIVWVTVSGETGGYAKTIAPYNPQDAAYTCEYTVTGEKGAYADAVIYGKNISDRTKYVYELDYSQDADKLTIIDLCAFTSLRELESGATDAGDVEILSVSNGKIRFVINAENASGQKWSGVLNIVRFECIAEGSVTFTLRIYE